jgi:hypothetical protein
MTTLKKPPGQPTFFSNNLPAVAAMSANNAEHMF